MKKSSKSLTYKFTIFVLGFFLIFFLYEKHQIKVEKEQAFTGKPVNASDSLNSINVYFNKGTYWRYSIDDDNIANGFVNFEDVLIKRINEAMFSIDVAFYEINLPRIVDALKRRAQDGVRVRIVADAKNPQDQYYQDRYDVFKLYLEKLSRGKDGILGTDDDIVIFSDAPIFAVENRHKREEFGLPINPEGFNNKTVKKGKREESGYLLSPGVIRSIDANDTLFYAASRQMHNKFIIIDGKWVWTGSWNFNMSGLYGSRESMEQGRLDGNLEHVVEIHNYDVAFFYTQEFERMWGTNSDTYCLINACYRKNPARDRSYFADVGGVTVEIMFSPGNHAMDRIIEIIRDEADYSIFFEVFAWSDQKLVDKIKYKYEGCFNNLSGNPTGFEVRGVFDDTFWDLWWSASVDMRGVIATRESDNNPNTRWNNSPDIRRDSRQYRVHCKTMIIDADTDSDPIVITGSMNWSMNVRNNNNENTLIIRDDRIVNQFRQAFEWNYVRSSAN